jgi:hypothetical protein
MIERKLILATLLSFAFSAASCDQLEQTKSAVNDSDLRLTLGGYREGHPEEGELNGVCTPNVARTSMDCDIYNGLAGWSISEVTIVVTWSPYGEDDKRYYSERVSIEPQKTQRIAILLGLQLPIDTQIRNRNGVPIGRPSQHWGWNLVAAKGHPVR